MLPPLFQTLTFINKLLGKSANMVSGMSVSKLDTYRSSERKYCKYYRLYILNFFVILNSIMNRIVILCLLEKCYLDNMHQLENYCCKKDDHQASFSLHCLSQKRELLFERLKVKIDLKL